MLPWLQTELYSETCMNLYLIFYRCFFSVWSSLSTINPRFITFANKEPQKAWFRSPGGYKAYRVLRLRCDANILNSIWFTRLIVNALTTLLARRLFIHCHSIQFCQLTVTRYSPGVPPVTGQILGVPGVPSFLAHSERFWGSNAGGSTIQIEFLGLVGPCMSYLWSPTVIKLPSLAMTRLPASVAVEVWSAFLGRFASFNRVLSWLGACILSFFQIMFLLVVGFLQHCIRHEATCAVGQSVLHFLKKLLGSFS